jgi:hypothetical protein
LSNTQKLKGLALQIIEINEFHETHYGVNFYGKRRTTKNKEGKPNWNYGSKGFRFES